jgi:hypothetical protein
VAAIMGTMLGFPTARWLTRRLCAVAGATGAWGGANGLAQVSWTGLVLAILRTFYGLMPYAAMALHLAVVSRSALAAIGGGLAYAMIELLLSLGGASWARYLPRGLVTRSNAAEAGAGTIRAP